MLATSAVTGPLTLPPRLYISEAYTNLLSLELAMTEDSVNFNHNQALGT